MWWCVYHVDLFTFYNSAKKNWEKQNKNKAKNQKLRHYDIRATAKSAKMTIIIKKEHSQLCMIYSIQLFTSRFAVVLRFKQQKPPSVLQSWWNTSRWTKSLTPHISFSSYIYCAKLVQRVTDFHIQIAKLLCSLFCVLVCVRMTLWLFPVFRIHYFIITCKFNQIYYLMHMYICLRIIIGASELKKKQLKERRKKITIFRSTKVERQTAQCVYTKHNASCPRTQARMCACV